MQNLHFGSKIKIPKNVKVDSTNHLELLCAKIRSKKRADMVGKAANKTTHEKLATRYGCYFSVLLELEYFNAGRVTVIDPMHNLFLGTAKRMFQLWLERDLTKSKLKKLKRG